MKTRQLQPYFTRQVLFLLAVLAVGLFAFSFAWYTQYQVYSAFSSAGNTLMENLGTNSSTTESVESFFASGAKYVLILALIGLGIFSWQYSQKRGVVVYD